jgi:hypothetical protein
VDLVKQGEWEGVVVAVHFLLLRLRLRAHAHRVG